MSEDGYADQSSGEDNVEQLQPADTLIDRGVDDVLDEGYIAPENWSPAQGFGNTLAEMRQGENLDMRVKQEEPEAVDPALGATDAGATVSGKQDDLQVALVVTTVVPSSVLRQRLGLLAGSGWQLRDVTSA